MKFKLEVFNLKESQIKKIKHQSGGDKISVNPYIKNGKFRNHLVAKNLNRKEVKKFLSLTKSL